MTTRYTPAALAAVAAILLAACNAGPASKSTRTHDTARAGDVARPAADGGAAPTSAARPGTGADTHGDPRLARADSARIQGNPSAPIWIVEVSDFQCPFCRQWHAETYTSVKREYVDAGKVRLAYINLPIESHANAWPAAEAAMCAAEQRKFWAMHDALFDAQNRWSGLPDPTPVFLALGAGVGVDTARLRECIASKVMRPLIQADRDRAVEAGVNSTPTFLVGGARLEGAYPIADFRRVVDSVLAGTAPGRKP